MTFDFAPVKRWVKCPKGHREPEYKVSLVDFHGNQQGASRDLCRRCYVDWLASASPATEDKEPGLV